MWHDFIFICIFITFINSDEPAGYFGDTESYPKIIMEASSLAENYEKLNTV